MGPYVKLRLLVKSKHFEEASTLIDEYINRYNNEEFILDQDDGYVPYNESHNKHLFSTQTQKMGIALVLSGFLGFGVACLYARRFTFALIFAIINASIYFEIGFNFWVTSFLFKEQVDF
jgi:hypothetical protein